MQIRVLPCGHIGHIRGVGLPSRQSALHIDPREPGQVRCHRCVSELSFFCSAPLRLLIGRVFNIDSRRRPHAVHSVISAKRNRA
jgi:hypothetical protein